jgi:hypothetical protein
MILKRLHIGGAFAALAIALTLLAGCSRPTRDPSTLRAIKAESQYLTTTHPLNPTKGWVGVPKNQWTPAIASLEPYDVTVYSWGVGIGIKRWFDGGWGYDVPHNKRDLPMPAECYSEPGEGVFWHGPC